MYVPETYGAALVLMLTSMVCWGSWPNFLKKLPKWRLEYFYLDYTLGFLITAVIYGATLGSEKAGLDGFISLLLQAGQREALLAIAGGFIWNIGNILLLNSIMIAGLAVAFPIAAIPAIVLGIGASYWLQPVGNPLVLATSVIVLLTAAQTTAAAYRRLGYVTTADKAKGVATLVAIPILIKHPLIGDAGRLPGYFHGRVTWHVLGLLAGAVWCSGTVFNFISASMVGVAISVGIGSGAPMIGALWGVFVWNEFAKAPASSKAFIAAALMLYAVGVATMAIAYTT